MITREEILKGIRNPIMALNYTTGKIQNNFLRLISPHLNAGESIYNRDWDVLILLDACRYDLFEEFAPQHSCWNLFQSVKCTKSVASQTPIWLERTFENASADDLADTHYVTCHAYAQDINHLPFHAIDHVWRYAPDPNYGLAMPEAVTDAGIDAVRNNKAGRTIIHYVQPHAPFLHCLGKYDSCPSEPGKTQSVWEGLSIGKYEKEEVWNDYGKNLLRVLDEVETVIQNVSGTIVVTSDHGNALGEWGVYGHPGYMPIAAIRNVPWAVAEGAGRNQYDVQGKNNMATADVRVEVEKHVLGQLEILGYK